MDCFVYISIIIFFFLYYVTYLFKKQNKYILIIYTVFLNTNINTSRYIIQNIVTNRLKLMNKLLCKSVVFMEHGNLIYRNQTTFPIPAYNNKYLI